MGTRLSDTGSSFCCDPRVLAPQSTTPAAAAALPGGLCGIQSWGPPSPAFEEPRGRPRSAPTHWPGARVPCRPAPRSPVENSAGLVPECQRREPRGRAAPPAQGTSVVLLRPPWRAFFSWTEDASSWPRLSSTKGCNSGTTPPPCLSHTGVTPHLTATPPPTPGPGDPSFPTCIHEFSKCLEAPGWDGLRGASQTRCWGSRPGGPTPNGVKRLGTPAPASAPAADSASGPFLNTHDALSAQLGAWDPPAKNRDGCSSQMPSARGTVTVGH